MADLGQQFLAAALGLDGAKALKKAVEREPQLADILIPRTIVGWLSFTIEHEYEGPIPGIENSYVQFQKSEEGFSGSIGLTDGVYSFEKASIYHIAAGVAMALGLEPQRLDAEVRDTVLVKLGKSIDTLTKAQVLMHELKSPGALKPQRMTTHGGYHVEHSGAPDRPYSVVHTRTGSQVQHGISSLKDAGTIADWHQNRYKGFFIPQLSKKVLDPSAGYQISHQHRDLGNGDFVTQVVASAPDGSHAGKAWFSHYGGNLIPDGVDVVPHHRRKGLASAIYAYAEKLTGKKILPSHTQTAMGRALWEGNRANPQFGKVELPGQSQKPQAQQGPEAPTPPQKQPKQQKPPSFSVGKSESEKSCQICGGQQFQNHKFKGCICFADLSKNIKTTAYKDGYVLEFKPGMDPDAIKALMKTFRRR